MSKKKTSEVVVVEPSVMTPDLNQIVNASLSKKDLLEIIEADHEEYLHNEKNKIDDQLENLFTKRKNIENELEKIYEDERERVGKIARILGKKIVDEMRLNYNDDCLYTSTSCNRHLNEDGTKLDDDTMNIEILYDPDLNKRGCSYPVLKFDINEQIKPTMVTKIIIMSKESRALTKEINALDTQLSKLDNNIKNLPKYMKKMSAELSRAALKSNEKGTQLLTLVNQIKQSKQV